MMVEEASQEAPQETSADTAEVKRVPHKGWAALVTFMAFMIYTMTAAYGTSFGTIFSRYLTELRTTSTKVSWIYNMFHVIACLCSVMGDTLVEELGWRKVMFVCGLLCSLGLALSALTTSADFLFFSYSLIAGCVYRILLFTPIHVAVTYCPNCQSLANGIVCSGSGIGLLMSAPFVAYLTENYTFRGAALIFSGVCSNICVGAMVFHPIKWHMNFSYSKFEGLNDNEEAFSSRKTRNACATLQKILKRSVDTFRLFKSPHAVILSIIVCFNIGIFLNIWTFAPFELSHEGYTVDEVSLCMSVAAACNMASRLVLAVAGLWLKQKSHILYILGSILSIGTLIAYGIKGNFSWKIGNLALCGLGFGITISLNAMIVIEIMGNDMLLPVIGLSGLLGVVWHLVIGPLIGLVIDVYESYAVGLFFLAGLHFLSTTVWGFLPIADAVCQRQRDQTRNEEHQQQKQQEQLTLQPFRENMPLVHSAAARPVAYASMVQ